MARIGILTFQFAHNYGAMLQAYALRTQLMEMGRDAEIIPYLPRGLWETYSLNPFRSLKARQWGRLARIPRRMLQGRKFRAFQRDALHLGSPVHALAQAGEFDLIIAGSDQVWNDGIVPEVEAYFLVGAPCREKAAYAASFGRKKLTSAVQRLVESELPRFKGVAVRERSAARLVKDMAGVEAVHVCDPVFLLSPQSWRELARGGSCCRLKKPYLLYVPLSDDPLLREKAQRLAQEKQLPVYVIHPTAWKLSVPGMRQLYDVGPLEYLQLVEGADCVATDSFHAAAFTCLFGGRLAYLAQGERALRVQDLMHTLNLNTNGDVVDFSIADQRVLEQLAARSRDYLAQITAPME